MEKSPKENTLHSENQHSFAPIPMQWVGPFKIISPDFTGDIHLPLATFETPLWPSTSRGAACSYKAGGITVHILDDRMTRSIVIEGKSIQDAHFVAQEIQRRKEEIESVANATSRFAKLLNLHTQIVGPLLYIRLEMTTGDASGHNMVTKASDRVLQWLLAQYKQMTYVSISANMCTDKKVSSINGILGRGKSVVAEVKLPARLVSSYLKTTPEKIIELNIKKNYIGSILAGGVRSANAHYANMLLGFYLATGQDAANIVEGSQGITYATKQGDDLYFSVSIPNIIVGTVGNGKHLEFVKNNLEKMGLTTDLCPQMGARRLAIFAACTVLAGELSLLAAQTNIGELVDSHMRIERNET